MATSQNQINPAYLLDPSLYGDQQAIDQQRQLAQLLMTQGLTSPGGTESVGGVAIRRSPFEGAGRLAQLLSGQSIQGQANVASQSLMQRQAQALAPMFGIGQPGQPQQSEPGQVANVNGAPSQMTGAPSGNATPAGMLGMPGMNPMQAYMSYATNPDKYMEAYLKGYTPNDTTIAARQGGVDPQMANRLALIKSSTDPKILGMQQAGMSPDMIYRAIFGENAKGAEISRRPGEGYANPMTGEAGMVGKIPEGANVTGPPGPNGQVSLTPMPGNTGVLTGNSAATGAGTAQNKMMTIKDADGNEQHMTEAQAIEYTKGGQSASQFNFKGLTGDPAEVRRNMIEHGAFGVLGAFDQQQNKLPGFKSGQSTIAAASATKAGALPQEEMSTKWTKLTADNSNAQTVVSRLQNIRELAEKAITGGEQERRDYLNSLFATVGFKPNIEAKTAGDLLDKNAAQIATALRMGSSGGTDALQTLVQAANPNRHMTKEAIAEAVDQLSASQQMTQAKANTLGPVANARDPQSYNAKEIAFDQAADPRIWQIKAMNAAQAQQFLSKLPPNVAADLKAKAMKLKELGAL